MEVICGKILTTALAIFRVAELSICVVRLFSFPASILPVSLVFLVHFDREPEKRLLWPVEDGIWGIHVQIKSPAYISGQNARQEDE